ncbi:hypothetical protein BDV27DRAFT_138672 [Aspergillus caelatus]|uniref:Uncharacterized protein n=1 Tax=Aspergillus caelatus TaxID=61420 RepID=A0A5N6ZJL1_9EURO|nr:uncharacterized protein BDV27DRAFT_138672 [Aspergillus caelatus]KAE8357811.1 hypothetical protein BDV27DRAFT_138672 [Aspergillus caelatus]
MSEKSTPYLLAEAERSVSTGHSEICFCQIILPDGIRTGRLVGVLLKRFPDAEIHALGTGWLMLTAVSVDYCPLYVGWYAYIHIMHKAGNTMYRSYKVIPCMYQRVMTAPHTPNRCISDRGSLPGR